MPKKKRKSNKKVYKKKSTAKNVAKKRPGSQSVYKVKGGYSVSKTKKRKKKR